MVSNVRARFEEIAWAHLGLDLAGRQLDLVDADRRAEASTRAPFGPLGVEPDEDRRGLPSRGVGAQPPRAARRRCLALVMGRRRFF